MSQPLRDLGAARALNPAPPVRARQLEMLAYISTEIHGAFKPMWHGGSDEQQAKARERIPQLLGYAATQMQGDYLFGADLTVSDC